MKNLIKTYVKLSAPLSRVWQAVTYYQEFGEWFRVKLEEPFTIGETSCGYITHPGYEHLKWEAAIQEMSPERLFSFTWHPYAVDPTKDYSDETPTLVEFRFEPAPEGTLLRIQESGFENIPEERREEAFSMHKDGWAEQMNNIVDYLSRNP